MASKSVEEIFEEMDAREKKWLERQRKHEDEQIKNFDVTDRRWAQKDFTQEMFDELPRPAQMAILDMTGSMLTYAQVLDEISELAGSC